MMKKLPQNLWGKDEIVSWLLSLANKPAVSLFLLLLLCIPIQLGRHFWPDFAFINGLRVDFLSPTLYLTDSIVLLAFVEIIPQLFRKASLFLTISAIVVLGFLTYHALSSLSPTNSMLGVLRLMEVIFLSLYISWFVGKEKLQTAIHTVLSISVIIVGCLTLWQFWLQSSVGGLWYFLGERSFTSVTPGIANASLNGNLVLRPYATFPHPNMLAGFLVIMLTYLLFPPVYLKPSSLLRRYTLRLAIAIGIIALVLTLSRTAAVVFTLVLIAWLLKTAIRTRLQKSLVIIGTVFLSLLVLQTGLWTRFESLSLIDQSVTIREFLLSQTMTMISHNMLLGVGLQNFLPTLAQQLPAQTPLIFFQPVHSFYLLLLSETGLVGLGIFLVILLVAFKRISITPPAQRLPKLILLGTFLLLGATDHYFYTLHQGQFLTAFVFGVIFAYSPTGDESTALSPREAKNVRTNKRVGNSIKTSKSQPVKIPRIGRSRQS